MASINSIMGGGSTSSIYGNKNILSGLASGMDTESMIENAVSGYKMKIAMLQQQRTMVEWQQTAYRNLIDKMVSFNQKYTSFSGGNNLMSGNFFDSAIKVISTGANAGAIAASGKTSSDIVFKSVSQLASSTRFTSGVDSLNPSAQANGSFDIMDKTETGALKGSLRLGYGGKTISISFNDGDVFEGSTPAEKAASMAEAINEKLSKEKITFDDGTQVEANKRIQAVAGADGTITFEKVPGSGSSNDVWIDSATGNIGEILGIDTDKTDKTDVEIRALKSFTITGETKLTNTTTMVDELSEKGFTMAVDGVSKTVKGPSKEELEAYAKEHGKADGAWDKADYIAVFQNKIDSAFGKGKLTVENIKAGDADGSIQLKFSSPDESKFSVSSTMGKKIGMESALTSYVNMNNKLGDVLRGGISSDWYIKADVKADDLKKGENGVYTDKDGNHYIEDAAQAGTFYKADKDGNALVDLKINGKSVGTFSKDSTLKDVMEAINTNENSDVKMAYSEFTNQFTFTSRTGGAAGTISFDEGLGSALFGGGKITTQGQDAKFTVVVNGEAKEVTHSTNDIEIDGMKITLKGTFNENYTIEKDSSGNITATEGEVTFRTEADADKIVDVVKDMVKDKKKKICISWSIT